MKTILSTAFISWLAVTPGLLEAQTESAAQSSAIQQAGTPSPENPGSAADDSGSGSASRVQVAALPVALSGYCPVSILDTKTWVKGSPKFAVLLDGKKYLFPAEEQRQKFLKNTTKYTPVLSGNCAVCAADSGLRTPGDVAFTVIHEDRLFTFPSEEMKAKFMADPAKYENVDLAFGGMCAVCKVELNELRKGDPAVGTIYGGRRYYFQSMDQKRMFLVNPAKYAVQD